MGVRPATVVELGDTERGQLEALLRANGCTIAEHRRARIVLLAAEGYSTGQIAKQVGVPPCTVSRWRTRIGRD
jgi:DNA-directed RNA polymerase specialized sigma24 family protein